MLNIPDKKIKRFYSTYNSVYQTKFNKIIILKNPRISSGYNIVNFQQIKNVKLMIKKKPETSFLIQFIWMKFFQMIILNQNLK